MLRILMPQKVENLELGYVVQSAGREWVEYVEPNRSVRIEVDRGLSTGIYRDTVKVWVTKDGEIGLSEAEIGLVIDRVDEALKFMGIKTELL